MLLNLLNAGMAEGFQSEAFKMALASVLLTLPIIILALSVHETAHGWVAYKLGDPTAKNLGRLTLNPLKHLNLFGFLAMMIVGFGWANPVPINTRNFKNPRWGMALSGIAGPVSNLLLATITFVPYIILNFSLDLSGVSPSEVHILLRVLSTFLYLNSYLNLSLAIFNLIPVPPFDGSRFLFVFLPTKWYFKVMKYERYTGIILLVLLLILSHFGISPVSLVVDFILDTVYLACAILVNMILPLILA